MKIKRKQIEKMKSSSNSQTLQAIFKFRKFLPNLKIYKQYLNLENFLRISIFLFTKIEAHKNSSKFVFFVQNLNKIEQILLF